MNFRRCMATSTLHNYYEILQLKSTSSSKEIKSSFYRLSFQYHPDRNSEKSAHGKFLLINEAYGVLSNSITRREYDESRSGNGRTMGGQGQGGQRAGWSSRTYRETLRPEDYILYRRGYTKQGGFDYKAHSKGHYGSGTDAKSSRRIYEQMYYKERYDQQNWRNSRLKVVIILVAAFSLYKTEFFQLIFI